MQKMNKYFVKGLMIGTFLGFVLTSPHRHEWAKRLECKWKEMLRRAAKGEKT